MTSLTLLTHLALTCLLLPVTWGHPQVDRDLLDDISQRYVGYCQEEYVDMYPGNSRYFWSHGYVTLQEPYPANCTLKYTFNTRLYPSDTFVKFGFHVTGTFSGPDIIVSHCNETDYVYLDDLADNTAQYCGENVTIDFVTGSDTFEFHFVSQEYSPRGLGFYVKIESIMLCGGMLSSTNDGPSGYISSPLHAANYPPNAACAWWFTAEDGYVSIKLECQSFVLEEITSLTNGTEYCEDKLSFTKELGMSETTDYCHTDLDQGARTIWSDGDSLLVTFLSSTNNHYTGFNCSYEFITFGN